MKNTELRIGNTVAINGAHHKVVGVFKEVAYIQYDIKTPIEEIEIRHLEVIELTDKILLSYGFKETSYNMFYLNGIKLMAHITDCKTKEKSCFFLEFGSENEILNIRVSYLHELQNIYNDFIGVELCN